MASNALPIQQYETVVEKININHCMFLVVISFLLRLVWMNYNGLLVEEAYYWNYAQHLDFSFYDHPPMVAVLIKLSTMLFGVHDFSVHLPALFCWVLTAVFTFKLTELIMRGAGVYAVMLFAVLPYFFMQSVVTTPDTPVMVCWASALYYLYRGLVLSESRAWYAVGICLGLGMVSKYTIVLLAVPTLIYAIATPSARQWFLRKEPYLAVVIALLLFSPVIYWNATHEWASFIFQSVRRFKSRPSFSLPAFIGLLLFFVTPVGIVELWKLFKNSAGKSSLLDLNTVRFFQLFTLLPLGFFGFYSLTHSVKFDWIGPGLLSVLPWFAVLIKRAWLSEKNKVLTNWFYTAGVLLCLYAVIISVTTMGVSGWLHQKILAQYFSWKDLAKEFNDVASQVETETSRETLFVPLDSYHIGSELAFYQSLFLAQGKVQKNYPIVGSHIFGGNSLMYNYWTDGKSLSGKTLILISDHKIDFDNDAVKAVTIEQSPLRVVWSHSQRGHQELTPFYYKIVEIKPEVNLNS
jgi:4-amino-4-deoxy-L-arabinose transferase-like glycosyltransferase